MLVADRVTSCSSLSLCAPHLGLRLGAPTYMQNRCTIVTCMSAQPWLQAYIAYVNLRHMCLLFSSFLHILGSLFFYVFLSFLLRDVRFSWQWKFRPRFPGLWRCVVLLNGSWYIQFSIRSWFADTFKVYSSLHGLHLNNYKFLWTR